MFDDPNVAAAYYATHQGRVTAALLGNQMRRLWPDLSRQTLLGLGHATPFLPLWQSQARLCIDAATDPGAIAADPAGSGADPARGPDAHAGTGCLVEIDALPFADGSIDRVLLVHGFETAAHPVRVLRAVGRVLRDDGRLLIVVPNRTGVWAHVETTPFAAGAPCSTGRIERLLTRSLFRIEQLRGALYGPPGMLAAAPMLETASRFVTARLAGVLVVEAVKDIHAAIPPAAVTASRRRVPARFGMAAA